MQFVLSKRLKISGELWESYTADDRHIGFVEVHYTVPLNKSRTVEPNPRYQKVCVRITPPMSFPQLHYGTYRGELNRAECRELYSNLEEIGKHHLAVCLNGGLPAHISDIIKTGSTKKPTE